MPAVKSVDLARFMGDWYVIADIPARPERNAYNEVESYAPRPDGRVQTTLRFREGGFDGEIKTKQGELVQAEETLGQKSDEIAAKKKEIDKALKEVEKSYATEEKRRNELLAEIPKDLLSRYNLIRKRTNLVVVNAKNGACQGCFMSLPPQFYNQVRRADTLYACPNCHRILTYEAPEAVKA